MPSNYHEFKNSYQDNYLINQRDENMKMSRENYRGFLFNITGMDQNDMVKKQEQSYIYVSEQQVVEKIQ